MVKIKEPRIRPQFYFVVSRGGEAAEVCVSISIWLKAFGVAYTEHTPAGGELLCLSSSLISSHNCLSCRRRSNQLLDTNQAVMKLSCLTIPKTHLCDVSTLRFHRRSWKTSEDKHQSLRRVHQVEPEEVNSGSTMITGSNQLLMHVPPIWTTTTAN